jgi:hypothetical protein
MLVDVRREVCPNGKRGLLAAYYVARKCGILGRLSEYGQVSINE